jgi:hypothetical protein
VVGVTVGADVGVDVGEAAGVSCCAVGVACGVAGVLPVLTAQTITEPEAEVKTMP